MIPLFRAKVVNDVADLAQQAFIAQSDMEQVFQSHRKWKGAICCEKKVEYLAMCLLFWCNFVQLVSFDGQICETCKEKSTPHSQCSHGESDGSGSWEVHRLTERIHLETTLINHV